ncbi:MAG: WD40/YVTN/BNR-like repeat-containing protein [Alphaproteobacteria bacterium]|jgi:photosystem II stability/assembly factor-like uncharacterized protein
MKSTLFVGAAAPEAGPDGKETCGVYRLASGTSEWRRLSNGLPGNMQVNVIERRPNNASELYAGSQLGLFKSMDGGDSWSDMGVPVDDRSIYSISLHPTDANTIYVGMDHTVIFKTTDGGASWSRLATLQPASAIPGCFPVRVLRMVIDPSNPEEVYAALEVGGFIRSLDGGASWEDMSQAFVDLSKQPHLSNHILSDNDAEGMLDLHALTISAAQPGVIWIANRLGLFISDDKGVSWREYGIEHYSELTYGRDILPSPHDPNVFYAALSDSARGQTGSLYRTSDLGKSWNRIDHDITIESTLMKVAVNDGDPEQVYCAARLGQVFGTEDGGATWNAAHLPDGVGDLRAIVSI